MDCRGTDVHTLATAVKAVVEELAAQRGPQLYHVHIYLQGEDAEAGGGHQHYGVYADTSFGGESADAEALNAALPQELYHLVYDEETYEDAHAAFAGAYDATL